MTKDSIIDSICDKVREDELEQVKNDVIEAGKDMFNFIMESDDPLVTIQGFPLALSFFVDILIQQEGLTDAIKDDMMELYDYLRSNIDHAEYVTLENRDGAIEFNFEGDLIDEL